MTPLYVRLGLFLLPIALSACATLYSDNAPKVKLVNIEPEEMGLFEQHYRVELRVINRSPEPLEMRGISFSLELNGRDFADGISSHELVIPGLSSAKIPAELSSSLFGIVNQVMEMTNSGKPGFRYRIAGTLYTKGATFGIPFDTEDELILERPVSGAAHPPGPAGRENPAPIPTE